MAVTQKLACRVERIVHHGEHVYTVFLQPARSVPRFQPGQFLHLALDPYDPSNFWPDSRAFSIASPPSQRNSVRISYSVRGRFTLRMEEELVEGSEVWIKMPYGKFVVNSFADVVLVAGGTGITAFMAFLETLKPGGQRVVRLAYGCRTEKLLIYQDEIRRCVDRVSSLDVCYFLEERVGNGAGAGTPGQSEYAGRLSVAAFWPRIPRPFEAEYYLAGPPAMLDTVARDLRAKGIGAEAIKIDAWE